MSEWIKVEKAMPSEDACYLVWDGEVVFYIPAISGRFLVEQFKIGEITHWQPLPAPPE